MSICLQWRTWQSKKRRPRVLHAAAQVEQARTGRLATRRGERMPRGQGCIKAQDQIFLQGRHVYGVLACLGTRQRAAGQKAEEPTSVRRRLSFGSRAACSGSRTTCLQRPSVSDSRLAQTESLPCSRLPCPHVPVFMSVVVVSVGVSRRGFPLLLHVHHCAHGLNYLATAL